jgi:hypothetical protein
MTNYLDDYRRWSIGAILLCGVLSFGVALGGCHGSSSDTRPGPVTANPPPVVTPNPPPVVTPNPPPVVAPNPPPVVPSGPTAVFTGPATANALVAVVFDASASVASDGSSLQYIWDFGNGQRGGGKTIAHLFATGGANSVKLMVIDGANRTATVSKTVTVTAAPATTGTVTTRGVVKTVDGVVIEGVTVTPVGATAGAMTDAMGKVNLTLGIGVPLTLKFSKAGYADQFLNLNLPTSAGADAYFEVAMRARDAALTLADAAAGGTLTGRDGAVITLPANALVTAAGTAVTGAVQISLTPVDVTQSAAGGFPGSFDGLKQDGTMSSIVSLGVNEFVLSAGGQALQLAPGKSATIEVPIYGPKKLDGTVIAVGDTTPLWSLDEATGVWIQEGIGTVVASAGSPSGLAMRATVTHLSWWNSDMGFDPFGPQPQCVYDTSIGIPGAKDSFASATICNMLAQIDRGLGASGASAPNSARIAAVTLSPRIAGYSRRQVVPIAGGQSIPVPSNVNIALTALALNGTWGGSAVVNGAAFAQTPVIIKMRPLYAAAGPTPEAITLPFDGTRSLPALPATPTALFTFSGAAYKFASITVTPASGSALTGALRLLQGTTVVAKTAIAGQGGQINVALPGAGTYTIDVTGDSVGAFRLQAQLLGGVQDEALALPVDITRTMPSYTTYHGTLTIAGTTTVFLAVRQQTALQSNFRLIAPDGTVLYAPVSTAYVTSSVSLTLTAGNYLVEVKPDPSALPFRLTIAKTPWVQVGPGLDTVGVYQMVDLIVDRNGKPVVGYVNPFVHDGRSSDILMLRRWTGTAWETVAADLTIDRPCSGNGPIVSFAFDSANNPVVAYANMTTTSATFVSARRYSSGAWQALGTGDGTLPMTSPFSSACNTIPVVAIGADDAPLLAYRSDNNVVVQRFDGTAWKGLADPAAGDIFALQNSTYDLKVDAAGNPWFITDSPTFSGTKALARRFNSTTRAWETIGGPLPQIGTLGLNTPRLRFDSSGNPVIGWVAGVGTGGVSSPGTAVYRYNGSVWSTTGGYQIGPDNVLQAGPGDFGFTLFNGDALASWTNTSRSAGASTAVVQRNTASGWSAFGAGNGEVPQYSPLGITDTIAYSSRLVTVGSELYMAVITTKAPGIFKVTLLRYVVN